MGKNISRIAALGSALLAGSLTAGCSQDPETPELDRLTATADLVVLGTVDSTEGLGVENEKTGKMETQYLYLVDVQEVLAGSGVQVGDRFEVQVLHSVDGQVVSTDMLERGSEAIWFLDDTGTVAGAGYTLSDPEGVIRVQSDLGAVESGDTPLHVELKDLQVEGALKAIRDAG